MLITDDDPNNELFEVVQQYNRNSDNKITNIPVRIFTYMIGRDITTTPELERLACENRGLLLNLNYIYDKVNFNIQYLFHIYRQLCTCTFKG